MRRINKVLIVFTVAFAVGSAVSMQKRARQSAPFVFRRANWESYEYQLRPIGSAQHFDLRFGFKALARPMAFRAVVNCQDPENYYYVEVNEGDVRLGKVCLDWTSIGDNTTGAGMGTYDIRYRTDAAITATNWDDTATTKAVIDLAAYPAGALQSTCLTDVPIGYTYYIAISAQDKVKNVSKSPSNFKAVTVDFTKQQRTGITGAKGWGAIMAPGDFNCDGYVDLAVGNPDEGTNKEGTVYIYLGSKNGYLQTPEKVISGTVSGGQFGAALASMPNFNKDPYGCRDLAVLASHGKSSKSAVYIYFGRAKIFDRDDLSVGKGADVVYNLTKTGAFSHLAGLAGVGDMDNDGLNDLAVTYLDGDLTTGTAEVWVIYGSKQTAITSTEKPVARSLPADAGLLVTGGKPAEMFADSVVGGRITGDFHSDMVISAPGKGTGAVYLVTGAKQATTLPETIDIATSTRVKLITGDTSNGSFGTAVAFMGDMDGDGIQEFAVSDPTTDSNTGTVYIFNVVKKLPKTAADAVGTVTHDITGATGDKFGSALGDAGYFFWKTGADLTGDGLADLVVAAKTTGAGTDGSVYLIKGQKTLTGLTTSKAYYTFTHTGAASFGSRVVLARDINGKNAKNVTHVDIVVGDPLDSSGTGRLFTYY